MAARTASSMRNWSSGVGVGVGGGVGSRVAGPLLPVLVRTKVGTTTRLNVLNDAVIDVAVVVAVMDVAGGSNGVARRNKLLDGVGGNAVGVDGRMMGVQSSSVVTAVVSAMVTMDSNIQLLPGCLVFISSWKSKVEIWRQFCLFFFFLLNIGQKLGV